MANKIHTLLGSDISIVGDISYEGIVHIEASVEGSLVANKSKESKLYINKASIVKGYVDATNIADGSILQFRSSDSKFVAKNELSTSSGLDFVINAGNF